VWLPFLGWPWNEAILNPERLWLWFEKNRRHGRRRSVLAGLPLCRERVAVEEPQGWRASPTSSFLVSPSLGGDLELPRMSADGTPHPASYVSHLLPRERAGGSLTLSGGLR